MDFLRHGVSFVEAENSKHPEKEKYEKSFVQKAGRIKKKDARHSVPNILGLV